MAGDERLPRARAGAPRPAHCTRALSPAPRVLAGSRRHATITPRFTANLRGRTGGGSPLAQTESQTESQTEASPIDLPEPRPADAEPPPPAARAALEFTPETILRDY